MTPTAIHRAIGSLLLALAAGSAAAQGNQQVEVVGTSPLPGLGVDRDWLPYAAQVARREQIDRAQADTLTDHLARRAAGVQVNDIQGSPYQGDLTLRGHRASGLLGAAQGLSVVPGRRAHQRTLRRRRQLGSGARVHAAFGDR
jgi:outer membrane cobalamin receptor